MKKRIVVEYGNVKKLSEALNCTPQMTTLSLAYKRNSILARKIRRVAVEQYGGVEVGE